MLAHAAVGGICQRDRLVVRPLSLGAEPAGAKPFSKAFLGVSSPNDQGLSLQYGDARTAESPKVSPTQASHC